MSELKIHVHDTLEDMGARFAEAWRRAERGETVQERHLSFDSFETLARTLTPRRLDLLRHIHRTPAASIAALARAVGRDCRSSLRTAGQALRGWHCASHRSCAGVATIFVPH